MRAPYAVFTLALLTLIACNGRSSGGGGPANPSGGGATPPQATGAAPATADAPAIQLVESWPLGTTLDHADVPDAAAVWLEMIEGATERIDLLEFYGVTAPGSALERVLAAIEARADAGVKVRAVFDAKFYEGNKEVPDRLGAHPNIEVRIYDAAKTMGGVVHIKLFIVDGRDAFLGSQNLDWRSLEHIVELGVRLRHRGLVEPLVDLFELDWALAGETLSEADQQQRLNSTTYGFPLQVDYKGEEVFVELGVSPRDWLLDRLTWELAGILDRLRKAKTRVRIQLLNYSTINYDKTTFTTLDETLRAIATRGVKVELMVADWSKREKYIKQLQSLQKVPNITVKIVTIPPWSGGFIPFARVIHSKFMTIDDAHAWVGTSNWSGDYFFQSRNASLFVDGARFTADLDALFEGLWSSPLAETVDPDATYTPPRVKE